MEIVTGATGAVHVTPIDDAVRNSNAGYIEDKVVFTCYENLSARDITANEVRVFAGYGMNQGRLFKIPRNTYDSVTIENGSSGYKRADLIVARYTMDSQTGFESMNLLAIRGQSGDSYVDPEYATGDINAGADLDDFPLYRVKINGLLIEAVEPLFTPLPDGGRIGLLEEKLNSDLYTNLESELAGSLDGSEEVNLGVKGVLPVAHGGTGKNNLNEVRQALGLGNDTTKKLQIVDGGTGANSASQARANLGVPPTNHASSENTYGKGDNTQYGHVKLSDATDSTSGTADGIAATPKAVKDTKDYLLQQMSQAGYGDMMSDVYCGENGAIIPEKGGTGQTTLQGARNAMGLGNTLGALPVACGGTGNTSVDTTPTSNSTKMVTSGGVKAAIESLQATFQDGVNAIYNAIVNNGVTPSASTPTACATAIDTIRNRMRFEGEFTSTAPMNTAVSYSVNGRGKIETMLVLLEPKGTLTLTGQATSVFATVEEITQSGFAMGSYRLFKIKVKTTISDIQIVTFNAQPPSGSPGSMSIMRIYLDN